MDGMQESVPWKQPVMVTCLQKGSAYRNEAWRIRCGLLSQRATGASEELRLRKAWVIWNSDQGRPQMKGDKRNKRVRGTLVWSLEEVEKRESSARVSEPYEFLLHINSFVTVLTLIA